MTHNREIAHRLIMRMRDLGWSGDADRWEFEEAETHESDMSDFVLDLRAEIDRMETRERAQCARYDARYEGNGW